MLWDFNGHAVKYGPRAKDHEPQKPPSHVRGAR